jgi:hypothetical protein
MRNRRGETDRERQNTSDGNGQGKRAGRSVREGYIEEGWQEMD